MCMYQVRSTVSFRYIRVEETTENCNKISYGQPITGENSHHARRGQLLQCLTFWYRPCPMHERHQASILTRIVPDVLDLIAERSAGLLESSTVAVAAAIYQNDLLNLIQFNSGFHFKGSRAAGMSRTARDVFNCTNGREDPRIGPQSMGTSRNSFGC